MNKNEIRETIERYNSRLDEFGVSEQALGWGEKGRAKLRYEILLSRWDVSGGSLLDFGCGFGDMFGYISSKGIPIVQYTGVDINARFIEIAKQRYKRAKFVCGEVPDRVSSTGFDYVLSSGVFNHALEDNMGFIKKSFDNFDRMSKTGFAVNFLSNKVDFQYDYTYHADPSQILELAYTYSNNVVLRNDYMPFEFTIFVDKQAAVDDQYTVYNDYLDYV